MFLEDGPTDNLLNLESKFIKTTPSPNMIFISNGNTDIPSMKLVKTQGGSSLAVFNKQKWEDKRTQEKMEKLISENRVNYKDQKEVIDRGLIEL